MWAIRLKAGGWIGIEVRTPIEAEAIPATGSGLGYVAGEVAVLIRGQFDRQVSFFQYDLDLAPARRPDPKVNASRGLNFRPNQ
jgi:hypothetical protein